jgi:mRNA interferase MazF
MYRQLDILWVNLNPTRGAETYKDRPCVILQADRVNNNSRTFIVAPILPDHRVWPFVVNVTPSAQNGLDKERHINLKQLRVVDISRFSRKQGKLESHYLHPIQECLEVVFGM